MLKHTLFPSRRELLKTASAGFGFLAFAGLSTLKAADDERTGNPLAPKAPHFDAKAKRVIFLCMRGGPSHLDTFDYKPELIKNSGRSAERGARLMKSPWNFHQHGDSGLWISELLPNLAAHADDLCLIRSMQCDQPTHPRAFTQLHTGNAQFVRPSLGAWTLYGLGTENNSMPGFVALNPPAGAGQSFGSSFLPAVYQASRLGRPSGRRGRGNVASDADVANIRNPRLSKDQQRRHLDLIQSLNRDSQRREPHRPEIEGVIESFELAFRMQDTLPELMDLSGEDQRTLALYGIDGSETDTFGRQCLLARRMSEAGVRFIELTDQNWDHHTNLSQSLPRRTTAIDKPIAGLLTDLKQRGLLEETLVVWAGEFGRTPGAQNGDGRDHNHKGYTSWMAGGGVRGGFSYGATDEIGYEAVQDKCHIHDWHATILHLLGLDHKRLTYRYAGRDFRLTDVYGNVASKIIA